MTIVYTNSRVRCSDAPDSHASEKSNGHDYAANPHRVVSSRKWLTCNVCPFQIEYISTAYEPSNIRQVEVLFGIAYSKTFKEKYKDRHTVIDARHCFQVVRLRSYTRIMPEITSIIATTVCIWQRTQANGKLSFLLNCFTRRPVMCECYNVRLVGEHT